MPLPPPPPITARSPRRAGGGGGGFVHSEFRTLLRPTVLLLATMFCVGQLFQELIAEAIFTRYEFPRSAHEVALVYGFFQQVGAVCVALLSSTAKEHANPHSSGEQTNAPISGKNKALSHARTWGALYLLTLLIFASSILPNLALHYVHFPAKVVAKSTKLVPTMLVSVVFGNSTKFSKVDYISAALLCCGAIVFAFSSTKEREADAATSTEAADFAYVGLAFLATASCADALVPNIQQYLMRTRSVPTAEDLAFRVNALGSAAILAYVLVVNQALGDWLVIFAQEPSALMLLCGTALCSGIFVLAYTRLIQEAGSVVAMAIATARKVLTLTLSYLVFPGRGKRFTTLHLVSALAVALGMGLGPLWERYHLHKNKPHRTAAATAE